jgi:osmotically inducible protein OsmC
MDRSASAVWRGSLKEGKGTISTQSGTLAEMQYSFSMALSAQLTDAGFTADSIETKAVLTLDMHGAAPTITKIHLTTKAKVPNLDKAKFDELAHNAEVGCPVSRLLKAAEITLDATLL